MKGVTKVDKNSKKVVLFFDFLIAQSNIFTLLLQ